MVMSCGLPLPFPRRKKIIRGKFFDASEKCDSNENPRITMESIQRFWLLSARQLEQRITFTRIRELRPGRRVPKGCRGHSHSNRDSRGC